MSELYDIAAELRVIGAFLAYPDLLGSADLKTDDFAHIHHRRIYATMRQMWKDGSKIDALTVDDATDNKFFDILSADTGGVLAASSLDFWIDKIKTLASRRRYERCAEDLLRDCRDENVPMDVLERNAMSIIDNAYVRNDLTTVTLHDKPPHATDWLINGVLSSDTCVVCGAEDKAGKSWLLFGIALSLVTGRPLLGKWETRKTGKVLIYSPEGSWNSRSQRLWGMCWAMGLSPSEVLKDIIFVSGPFDLNTESHIGWMRRTLKDVNPVLLILDPLVCVAMGLDENTTKEMQPVLQSIRGLGEVCPGLVTIVAHHMSKSGADRNMSKSLRGSSAIPAWLDTQINIYVEGDSALEDTPRRITFRHRDGRSPLPYGFIIHEEHTLEHMVLPPGQCAYSLLPYDPPLKDNADGSPRPSGSKLDAILLMDIIKTLSTRNDGASGYLIAKEIGTNHKKIGRYLKHLQDLDRVYFDGKNWSIK